MIKKQYTYRHRGHSIVPKRDFGRGGYVDGNGKIVNRGWVVTKDNCNIMPGGTWFKTPKEARNAINVLLRVKGDAEKFWEIMQPFKYTHIGQKVKEQNCTIRRGRFWAKVDNGVVVALRDDLNPNGL